MDWISVEDRLPSPKGTVKRVLVNVNGYGVCSDRFIKASGEFHKFYGYVTHWMPLPEPPK